MQVRVYHGSGVEFESFKASNARVVNDHYGGMLYFTDNPIIAKQYAQAGSKKTSKKVIYTVELTINNLFDVNEIYTGNKLKKILGNINLEQFARNAGLLPFGSDKYAIIASLKSGDIELTGDQIFQGLSAGQQNTVKTREKLKSAGFDALRYYGAKIFGVTPHMVYLPYNENSIKILDVKLVD